jgi:hypothetical protein
MKCDKKSLNATINEFLMGMDIKIIEDSELISKCSFKKTSWYTNNKFQQGKIHLAGRNKYQVKLE